MLRIMTAKAMILGLKGKQLSDEERAFFSVENPWGFILFARNIDTPEQVSRLCEDLRLCVGRSDAPILIDQEGGRVQRFRPPHWAKYPSARVLGELYEQDKTLGLRATWLMSRLHAFDLSKLGVTVNCLPVLDVPSPDGHDVIGDRAYGRSLDQVVAHGRAACSGLSAGGVAPVIKHIPGHGRATVDTHHALPVVNATRQELRDTDFAPFKKLNDQCIAMTAHVIYSDIDPDMPATTSKKIISECIRGDIGFDGLLVTDDIGMNALSGDFAYRTSASFAAGCDIVTHCHAHMDEMIAVASETPHLAGKSLQRAELALTGVGVHDELHEVLCRAEFSELTAPVLSASAQRAVDPTKYGKTA